MPDFFGINELSEGAFPINFKIIDQYQLEYPILTDKLKCETYKRYDLSGGRNTHYNIIICKDEIIIPSKLKIYVFNWYHTYILNPGMDIM